METVPYITATLIADQYMGNGEVAMHHHLIGHTVDSVHRLRYPPELYDDQGNETDALSPCNAHWPMVDLWARVPVTVFYNETPENDSAALHHAKRLQRITEEYKSGRNAVGW